jgi:hypothetical protein
MSRTKLTLAALVTTAILFACGSDPGPLFTPPEMPENQAAFNQGRIGLLTPNLRKEGELIAFRLLSGLEMNGKSIGGRHPGVLADSVNTQVTEQQAWLEKRHTITDPAEPGYIDPDHRSQSGNDFVYYENCLGDAFETAARTLEDRRTRYPSASTLKGWVIAQDQVFENCASNKPAYPEPLQNDAPPLARADREYQIAAAHFYAQDLNEAEQRFRRIAIDDASPWQHIAVYMVGRTLTRQASLQNNAAALTAAREQFSKVSEDKSAGTLAESARRLIEHLNALEHADATLQSLSKQFLTPQASPAAVEDVLQQSAFVLRAASFQKELASPDVPETFDWVQTLENGNEEHALERWRSRKSLPWLIIALMYASGKDPAAGELIAEAERLADTSPGAVTATYNAIRLHLERGETEQVRGKLDKLLTRSNDQPDSLVNAWRAERMRLATSFDDLLRWAPRQPVDPSGSPGVDASPVLAYDAAYVLNYLTPLAKLNHAAHSDLLPFWSARDVALAGWTRAFMLNDLNTARELAPVVAKAHPDWAASLTPRTGPESDGWRFQAAMLIVLHHEFQPLVRVDYSVFLDTGSWWCPVTVPTYDALTTQDNEYVWIAWHLPAIFAPPESALSQRDRTIAGDEIRRLHDEGSAQSFVAPLIFKWAATHPDDPLVPQALHRLVVVTRYGCSYSDPSTSRVSKTAFELLHKKYPRSPWTARTPYWF